MLLLKQFDYIYKLNLVIFVPIDSTFYYKTHKNYMHQKNFVLNLG